MGQNESSGAKQVTGHFYLCAENYEPILPTGIAGIGFMAILQLNRKNKNVSVIISSLAFTRKNVI